MLYILFISNPTLAQTFATIDGLLTNNLSTKYAGNVVAMVMHNNSLVYYKALGGYDSLTVKPIASLTKNFSGCVILGLAQDGAFNLDDSIGMYLPYATTMGKGVAQSDKILAILQSRDGITGNTYLTDPYLNMQQCVDSIITYDPIIYTPGNV